MNYYNYLSGGMTPQHFLAALSIGAYGWAFYKAISFLLRNKQSKNTPPKASLSFWWRDNWQQAIAHAIVMIGLIRFASEILAHTVPNSAEWIESNDPMWIYFAVGLLKSVLIERLHKKTKSARI